ncbi:MAG: DUF5777 family beta-barrel protein [Vicinamibacterales bacterium]
MFQRSRLVSAVLLAALLPITAAAQNAAAPAQPAPERNDPDALVDPIQPDFTLAALPTTLRMPKGKWAFRVTHRFTRAVGEGNLGDLVADAFGLDRGAQVGLELRFGLFSGTQLGVHRTSDRSTQLFVQHSILKQRDGGPLGLDGVATLEGYDNLTDHHQSALGFVVSKNLGRRAALYAEPVIVVNANPFAAGDNNSLMLGLGTRLRIRPSTYLVAEYTPRLTGYDPNDSQISFALEGRAGGHLFQLNVSNGFGTTLGQLAAGGISNDQWFLGFNLSRKFF